MEQPKTIFDIFTEDEWVLIFTEKMASLSEEEKDLDFEPLMGVADKLADFRGIDAAANVMSHLSAINRALRNKARYGTPTRPEKADA